MKITAVRVRKLVSRQNSYGHDAVEMEAEIEDGDDVDEVIAALHVRVDAEIRQSQERERLGQTLDALREQVKREEHRRDALKKQVAQLCDELDDIDAFAEKAREKGLKLPRSLAQRDVPF